MRFNGGTLAILAALLSCYGVVMAAKGQKKSTMTAEEEKLAEKDLTIEALEFQIMEKQNLLQRYIEKHERRNVEAGEAAQKLEKLEQAERLCEEQSRKTTNKINNLQRARDECEESLDACERRFNQASLEVKDMYLEGRQRDKDLEECRKVSSTSKPAKVIDAQAFKEELIALKGKLKDDLPLAKSSELYMDMLYIKYGECWLEVKAAQERGELGEKQSPPGDELKNCQRYAGTVRTNFDGCLEQVETVSAQKRALEAKVASLKADLQACHAASTQTAPAASTKAASAASSASPSGADSGDGCRECADKLRKSEALLDTYAEKLSTCKLQKQSVKVMKWYLRKMTVKHQDKNVKLSKEVEEAKAALVKEQKKVKQANKETEKLGKELVRLQRSYADTTQELEELTTAERSCDAEKEHYKMLKSGMDLLLENTENEQKQCKEVKDMMEVELEKAIKEASQFRMNFTLTIIALVILGSINAYFIGSARYATYVENERLAKAAERRDRKEARGKGRKVKSQ